MTALSVLVATLAGAALGTALSWMLLRRKIAQRTNEWRDMAESLHAEVKGLAEQLRERDQARLTSAPVPNGFNMNRRPDAVRRLHSGIEIDRVAAGTGWSIPEIVLLEKIERMSLEARH